MTLSKEPMRRPSRGCQRRHLSHASRESGIAHARDWLGHALFLVVARYGVGMVAVASEENALSVPLESTAVTT